MLLSLSRRWLLGRFADAFPYTLQQPLLISGSQDGTARLLQVQTKRVLATLSHDGAESTAGTVNETSQTTENSVEWCVCLRSDWRWGSSSPH